jgi:ribosomal protein S1
MDSKKKESARNLLASIDEVEVMELDPDEERPKTAL